MHPPHNTHTARQTHPLDPSTHHKPHTQGSQHRGGVAAWLVNRARSQSPKRRIEAEAEA